MNFSDIILNRKSCRKYDESRHIEDEKLEAVLTAARLSPSACNGQPYHITVCKGKAAKRVARATQNGPLNRFATEADVMLVISEGEYVERAARGAEITDNDYRSMDIGILAAYITAAACEEGLSSCIIGWCISDDIKAACGVTDKVRLVIALGYAHPDDTLRPKTRKEKNELISYVEK